ncbi:hypothetical protein [Peterkaempfera griseoplana]|uniref:hypothetical protein n=1 Tax=Peterkaempfera griseoplana TaxID=66896 RepID=UPI0006E2A3F9|nr:hypothetical protein [Peterkaempfera griseoplana]
MQSKQRAAVAAAAAVAALLVASGPATADTAPQSASPSAGATAHAPGDGARALCRRVPGIEKRIDRALRRLDGKAGRRGSVARLEKRVLAAKQAGHTEIATYLEHRLTVRKSLTPTLRQRRADLAEVAKWCGAHSGGASS